MTDKMPETIWAHENPDRGYNGEKILPHYHAYPEAAYSLGRDQRYVRADLADQLATALEGVLRIADRKHDVFDTARTALEAYRQGHDPC